MNLLCDFLLFVIYPLKLVLEGFDALVSMSKRTGMSVSQVADEVLYTGLIEMKELDTQG